MNLEDRHSSESRRRRNTWYDMLSTYINEFANVAGRLDAARRSTETTVQPQKKAEEAKNLANASEQIAKDEEVVKVNKENNTLEAVQSVEKESLKDVEKLQKKEFKDEGKKEINAVEKEMKVIEKKEEKEVEKEEVKTVENKEVNKEIEKDEGKENEEDIKKLILNESKMIASFKVINDSLHENLGPGKSTAEYLSTVRAVFEKIQEASAKRFSKLLPEEQALLTDSENLFTLDEENSSEKSAHSRSDGDKPDGWTIVNQCTDRKHKYLSIFSIGLMYARFDRNITRLFA